MKQREEQTLKCCTFTKDDGTWCGNKPYQIIVDFDKKEVFCFCKKHRISKWKESMRIININSLMEENK